MIGCLEEEARSSPEMTTAEEWKQKIQDFAESLEPAPEDVSAHHFELSIPYSTIVSSEDTTVLPEDSTASPSIQGDDFNPDDGVTAVDESPCETYYAKLMGFFSKAKGWVLDMNSSSKIFSSSRARSYQSRSF